MIEYRRRREYRTDYKKRLKLIASGAPRFVVRKSLKNILVQITGFHPDGDKVIESAHTNELSKKFGWPKSHSNLPSAYLTGLLLAKKAKEKGIKKAVLDIGLNPPVKGSLVYAALKGALDADLNIPHSPEALPDERRIKGQHIVDYSKKNKTMFTRYDPETLSKLFETVKNKILEKKP